MIFIATSMSSPASAASCPAMVWAMARASLTSSFANGQIFSTPTQLFVRPRRSHRSSGIFFSAACTLGSNPFTSFSAMFRIDTAKEPTAAAASVFSFFSFVVVSSSSNSSRCRSTRFTETCAAGTPAMAAKTSRSRGISSVRARNLAVPASVTLALMTMLTDFSRFGASASTDTRPSRGIGLPLGPRRAGLLPLSPAFAAADLKRISPPAPPPACTSATASRRSPIILFGSASMEPSEPKRLSAIVFPPAIIVTSIAPSMRSPDIGVTLVFVTLILARSMPSSSAMLRCCPLTSRSESTSHFGPAAFTFKTISSVGSGESSRAFIRLPVAEASSPAAAVSFSGPSVRGGSGSGTSGSGRTDGGGDASRGIPARRARGSAFM